MISCIVLNSDSHKYKDFSLEKCINFLTKQTSIGLSRNKRFDVHTFEKDSNIIKTIQTHTTALSLHEVDFTKDPIPNIKSNTFITDPPHTINGILLFISVGLKTLSLNRESEFYVIINRSMIGNQLPNLLKILAINNVYLHSTIPNFSQYKIPKHSPEFTRVKEYFVNKNIKNIPALSSSSELFIFRTQKPNIINIIDTINKNLIFNNYEY